MQYNGLNLIKEELKNYIIEKTGTTGCKINSYRMEVIPRLSEHVEDVDLCELINTIEKNNHNKESNSKYQKPRNSIEEKLVLIWQELFETRKEISINDNFFKLGGHSLKVITLSSRINKEFNIDMPLEEIFNNPTIEGIAEYIQGGKEAKYSPIIEVAESLFYPASSAQKRLYSILQRKGSGLVYNTPFALIIDGNVDIKRLEDSFKTLMHRHESLRTSFKIIDNEIVQEIEKAPEFKINIMDMDEEDIDNVICNVVKPFELDKAPLFRVFSGKISQGKQLLLVDFHHIIVDGVSVRILFDELKVIYEGGSLTPLKFNTRIIQFGKRFN
jgi:acyl carrier protein